MGISKRNSIMKKYTGFLGTLTVLSPIVIAAINAKWNVWAVTGLVVVLVMMSFGVEWGLQKLKVKKASGGTSSTSGESKVESSTAPPSEAEKSNSGNQTTGSRTTVSSVS